MDGSVIDESCAGWLKARGEGIASRNGGLHSRDVSPVRSPCRLHAGCLYVSPPLPRLRWAFSHLSAVVRWDKEGVAQRYQGGRRVPRPRKARPGSTLRRYFHWHPRFFRPNSARRASSGRRRRLHDGSRRSRRVRRRCIRMGVSVWGPLVRHLPSRGRSNWRRLMPNLARRTVAHFARSRSRIERRWCRRPSPKCSSARACRRRSRRRMWQ